MEGSQDISTLALVLAYLLLLIPVLLAYYFKIRIVKKLIVSAIRMTGQLFVVGIVLIYFFELDNNWLNAAWVIGMIVFAAVSTVNNSELNYRIFLPPIFLAFLISTSLVLWFFNAVLVDLDNIFDARYLIVIGGMLLGNSLKGDIIGISKFYEDLKKDEKRYLYHLAVGASQREAIVPFFRDSMGAALKPFIASMATMGLVFLPGMMTGQIIGGEDPATAIKYQIAIMLAVFVATTLSVSLTIFITYHRAFDSCGILKKTIFRKNR
ncbi:ABC transporter permease [Fulvivirga ulvae]|uniref:ABC transporter permease n=1 Tax=Fulvivirga ulvae TaxID=2904245 RepID=UPI001F217D8C|nr:ABC transporter permease [Fulvivirga ulvae]UII33456.1 ABC transporter permease [Fulvivirga ulvae]